MNLAIFIPKFCRIRRFSAIFIKDFICIWIEICCLSPKYNRCFKNRLNSNLDAANYAKFNILVIV